MATKKKMLQAAAGNAAAYGGGAGALNVEDVFSTYLYEGNGDTQVIENGINLGQSNDGGGIYFPDGDGDYLQTATLPALSGEFTIELWFYSYDTDRAIYLIGNGTNEDNFMVKTDYLTTSGNIYIKVAGTSVNGNASSYYDVDGWNHLAITRNSSNVVSCYVNGSRISTATISGNLNSTTYNIGTVGGGSVSASGYELMYGYMSSVRISDTARYDATLTSITVPTSEFTSDSNTVLLLGQGDTPLADASSNSYSVTVNGNPRASEVGPFDAADAGEGGLVWVKNRVGANSHKLFDTERGALYKLHTDETIASTQETDTLSSFNANGFSVLSDNAVNGSTAELASWTFRKAPKFFTCLTYSGNGGTQTISHDLGSDVGMLIIKSTSAGNWFVWHRSLGDDAYLFLNGTNAEQNPGFDWIGVTSTTISLQNNSSNTNGETYVAYLFAHNDGDGEFGPDGDADIIKCGSYTGNGSSTGPVIDLGFEPQWLMIKNTSSSSGDWNIFDTMRGIPTGGNDSYLAGNTSAAEGALYNSLDLTSTGFQPKVDFTYINGNGNNYIYIAIRRGPMAVPTDATEVFDIATRDATHPSFDASFDTVDFSFVKNSATTGSWRVTSRLQGANFLYSDTTAAETSYSPIEWDHMDGWSYGVGTASTFYSWMWRRAPNFFDVVAYTGNGTAGRTVSHNLGVAPEMMWVKSRTSGATTPEWSVYHKDLGNDKRLVLNTTAAVSGSSATFWYSTTPTETDFYTGSTYVNQSGYNYIAYLFASVDGVSKIGSFTGNGSTLNVDCGFSSGARFVIIKKDSGPWRVFDTERGIVAGNDPFLLLNNTDAEDSGADLIDPLSSGFSVNYSSDYGFNINGETYLFYAVA